MGKTSLAVRVPKRYFSPIFILARKGVIDMGYCMVIMVIIVRSVKRNKFYLF